MSALTLAQAKSHLNISGTTYDTELQGVIDAAEAVIAQRCGPLTPTTVTRRVEGGYGLTLPVLPALTLTSVTPADGTALTLGDLYLDTASGVVAYNGGSGFYTRYYTVVYTAGRDSVPADLLFAVKELVRHLWETRRGPTRRPGSEPSESVPGAAYALPRRVEQMLTPHLQSGFA